MTGAVAAGLLAAALGYLGAAYRASARPGRTPWPLSRTAAWLAGLACAGAGLAGPLTTAHGDLRAHALAHVLTGMAAPLLLVLAAPVTLLLRALPTRDARRVSRLLRTPPARVLADPFVATALNAGGLLVLYGTGLLTVTAHRPGVHLAVALHALLTGWLATAAVLAVDPAPHRRGVAARTVAVGLGIAAHGVVARALYAAPPPGWTHVADGAQLLSSLGDVVHLAVLVLLWHGWYTARARVRTV